MSQERMAYEAEATATHTYVYDGDRLISYDDQTFYYTSMNCPEVYIGKEMDWDEHARLMACYTKDEQVISFAYDSHGRRVSKSIYGGTPTTFVYNKDGNLIYQSNGISFLYDHTGVMGMQYHNGIHLFRKNAQGDIIAIEGGAGKAMVEYIYDAWGNHEIRINAPLDSDEYTLYNELAQANPFRYRSYYFDTETGFYYLPARYYDPTIGRFISQDDHSYLDPETVNGLNLYAYCQNNPVMNFDPSGHAFISLSFLLIGMAVGAIAGLGLVTYADYVDDGQIFNGSIGWQGYLGGALGGAIVGGFAAVAASAIAAFAGMSFTIGSFMSAAGELVAVTVTGAQVIGAAALGLGVMLAKQSRRSGKESASDKPSWFSPDDINPDLSAHDNARNLLDQKYGQGNWGKGPKSEYNKIVKWFERWFRRYM